MVRCRANRRRYIGYTNEPVNLSGKPEKSEEIEALMKEKSVLDGFA
jgi:hypothetical protein